MKKIALIMVTIFVLINIPISNTSGDSDEYSDEYKEINLYIGGGGGGSSPSMQSDPPGNITTSVPTSTTDEGQKYLLTDSRSAPDHHYWFSDPLNADFSIYGDVHFTLWAVCSAPRYITIWAMLERLMASGTGHGRGTIIGSKLVYDEPVEFEGILSEESIDDDIKEYNFGDYIGMGISVEFGYRQPPAEVTILYNSSNHPSHMTINTKSIFIDVYNQTVSSKKAVLDLRLIDAFGTYDIVNYNIQLTGPSGKSITNFELVEYIFPDYGLIYPRIIWDKTEDRSGKYTVTITVKDNNDNTWEETKTCEFDIPRDNSVEDILRYSMIFIGLLIILVIIISIFILRKRKKRQA